MRPRTIQSVTFAFVAILGASLLTGCMAHEIDTAPKPNVVLQDDYVFQTGGDRETLQSLWWHDFDRPALDALIAQGFQNNQNIAQSIARLKQAEAIALQTRSARYPQIDLQGGLRKEWEGRDGQDETSDIGGALTWEVDAFNRIGSAAEADRLEAMARAEDVQTIKLSLSAAIADAYFGAVAAGQTLDLLQAQVDLDINLLDLLQLRFENGIGTSVDVLQQQSRVADSNSLIPLAQADLRTFENRIDVLLGQAPDGKNRVPDEDTLLFDAKLPAAGVPADLLLNRPDLRSARADLVAADADIASAIADRLPRITLTGEYLYSDTSSYAGPLGILMGSFVQPLLDWGKRKAEVERNEALYEENLAAYTQLYLEAAEDVENALYRENRQREFIKRLDHRRDLLQRTVSETEARYKQGVNDYLPVLSALQELRVVERQLISERLNLVQFRVQLHRALGGSISGMVKQAQKDKIED